MAFMIGQHELCPSSDRHHWQVFLQYKEKRRFTYVIKTFPGGQWHVEKMRKTIKHNVQYCQKSKTCVGVKFELGDVPSFQGRSQEIDECIAAKIAGASQRELARRFPKTMIRNYRGIAAWWQMYNEITIVIKYPLSAFPWTPCTDDRWGKSVSLILWGPPGSGKSCFAKAHFKEGLPPLWVCDLDDLPELFDPSVYGGIIFDDIDFYKYARKTQLHLIDVEDPRSIRIRYMLARIPAGVKKIFTTNREGGVIFSNQDTDEGIFRRLILRKCYGFRMRQGAECIPVPEDYTTKRRRLSVSSIPSGHIHFDVE